MKAPQSLELQPVTTRVFRAGENLAEFVASQVPSTLVRESMILAITSKIVSLAEERLVDKTATSKQALIDQEADHNLGEIGHGCFLTIKHGLFIPSAGIDESNSEKDQYILYPEDPFASAHRLWQDLRTKWELKNLGILMTDSHTTPLRRGVTGISLAHWGFQGLSNRIGAPDIFGREMRMTTVNIADALATAATLVMGETDECRPLAVLQCEGIQFCDSVSADELKMPLEMDLYYPFFKSRLD